jgi:hypothetical protein
MRKDENARIFFFDNSAEDSSSSNSERHTDRDTYEVNDVELPMLASKKANMKEKK